MSKTESASYQAQRRDAKPFSLAPEVDASVLPSSFRPLPAPPVTSAHSFWGCSCLPLWCPKVCPGHFCPCTPMPNLEVTSLVNWVPIPSAAWSARLRALVQAALQPFLQLSLYPDLPLPKVPSLRKHSLTHSGRKSRATGNEDDLDFLMIVMTFCQQLFF